MLCLLNSYLVDQEPLLSVPMIDLDLLKHVEDERPKRASSLHPCTCLSEGEPLLSSIDNHKILTLLDLGLLLLSSLGLLGSGSHLLGLTLSVGVRSLGGSWSLCGGSGGACSSVDFLESDDLALDELAAELLENAVEASGADCFVSIKLCE